MGGGGETAEFDLRLVSVNPEIGRGDRRRACTRGWCQVSGFYPCGRWHLALPLGGVGLGLAVPEASQASLLITQQPGRSDRVPICRG